MGKHQRATPLIHLMAKLGWQRDPDFVDGALPRRARQASTSENPPDR